MSSAWGHSLGIGTSVIVHDLDVLRALRRPDETEAKLIVDANAVLTHSVRGQRLQPIAGRYSKKVQRRSRVQLHQFAPRDRLDVGKSLDANPVEQRFGVGAFEGPDRHACILYR